MKNLNHERDFHHGRSSAPKKHTHHIQFGLTHASPQNSPIPPNSRNDVSVPANRDNPFDIKYGIHMTVQLTQKVIKFSAKNTWHIPSPPL